MASGYLCLWFPNIPGQGTVFIEDQGPELLVELLPDDSTCFFPFFIGWKSKVDQTKTIWFNDV